MIPARQAPDDADPRRELARRRLEAARAELEAAESQGRGPAHTRRGGAASPPVRLRDLRPSITMSAWLHGLLLTGSVTIAALGGVLAWHMMSLMFMAGRFVAAPVAVIALATLAYCSNCFLGVVISTSLGPTTIGEAIESDWREWIWTLPSSFGIAAAALALGTAIGLLVEPAERRTTTTIVTLLTYPILQLSTLETGSVLQPFSAPVWRSLVTKPHAWCVVFLASLALVEGLLGIATRTLRDPPYLTAAVVAPLGAVGLLIYAWLLGQLARVISTEE
ncbi:MAG: hypothetical protein KDA44_07620 [Planctomycetales bacterium]|nr:hypothetical protein [Planctomycetales bacterium]